jgi:predicted AlkP superfamily phosphohydrolase/phosphomutase
MVSGFLTPSQELSYTYPDSLSEQLNQMGYIIDLQIGNRGMMANDNASLAKRDEIYESLIVTIEKRVDALKVLSQENLWDLFFLVFKETDLVQHLFYDDSDIMRSFWRRMDSVLHDIFTHFTRGYSQDELYFFLVSDHGFHRSPDNLFNIFPFLEREGFIKAGNKGVLTRFIERVYQFVNKSNLIDPVQLMASQDLAGKLTRKIYQIYASKAHRERNIDACFFGIFWPTSLDKEKVNIMQRLRELEYKGEKVFRFVGEKAEFYHGAYDNRAPDIVLIPNEGFAISRGFGADSTITPAYWPLPGSHESALDGVFIGYGPGIIKGGKCPARVCDLVPTVLHILGLPISEDLDGHVLENIFEENSDMLAREITFEQRNLPVERDEEKFSYSPDEEQRVEERLRELGYL